MNILFLTTVLPHKKQIGSEVASQSIIDGLRSAGARVTTIGFLRAGERDPELPDTHVAATRYIETRQAKLYPALWFLHSACMRVPYSAAKFYARAYRKQVAECVAATDYDIVVIDHPQMAWVRPYLPRHSRLVFVAHNIEHQMYAQLARGSAALGRLLYQREATLIERVEKSLAAAADEVWTLTLSDAQCFSAALPAARVRSLSLPATSIADCGQVQDKQFDIGIIGSWAWRANQEGLGWFLDEVYPLLAPDVSIRVAGKGADWLAGRYANVRYEGFVPDAVAFMQQARVVAIPTLSGGGIQIKTLDAIGSGSRIVATPIALRGVENPPATVSLAHRASEFSAMLSASATLGTPQAAQAALAWSRARHARFLREMREALSGLAEMQTVATAA